LADGAPPFEMFQVYNAEGGVGVNSAHLWAVINVPEEKSWRAWLRPSLVSVAW